MELHRRQARKHFLPPSIFGEAAWNILLVLASNDGRESSGMTALLAHSGAPPSTTLRWVAYLEQEGFVVTLHDRMFNVGCCIALTDLGRSALERYFRETCG